VEEQRMLRAWSIPRCWERLAKVDRGIWVLLGWPWLLLLLNPTWVVVASFGEWLDPWLYTGFFLNLRHHVHLFPGTYYGSRLSWVLPGYLVHHALGPVAANLVLRLLLFCGTLLCIYLVLRETVSRRAALVAALAMGCSTWFLASIGWDYIDGPANLYFVVSLLLLMYAGKSASWWRTALLAAGMACSACVSAQLFLVVFVPLLGGFYVTWNRQRSRHGLCSSALLFGGGCLAGVFLFGVISWSLGQGWLWFMPSVRMLLQLSASNPWNDHVAEWLPVSVHLSVPIVIAVGSLLLSAGWLRGWWRRAPMALFFQVFYLLEVAIMVLCEARGNPALQHYYYASFLLPGMFLAFGSQVEVLADSLSETRFRLIPAAVLLTGALPLAYMIDLPAGRQVATSIMVGVLAVGLLALALLLVRRWRSWSIAAAVAALGLCNWLVHDSRVITSREAHKERLEGWQAVIRGARAVRAWEGDGAFTLWYDAHETSATRPGQQLGGLFRSIGSCYLWGYKVLNEDYPAVATDLFKQPLTLGRSQRLIVLTARSDAERQVREAWEAKGFGVRLLGEQEVHQGDIAFRMLQVAVERLPQPDDSRPEVPGGSWAWLASCPLPP
jgi:hypothetical protein